MPSLSQKLIDPQLVEKPPAFFGVSSNIGVLARARYLYMS